MRNNVKIILTLAERGWLSLNISTNDQEVFQETLEFITYSYPVIRYNRSLRRYVISVYYIDELIKTAKRKGWDLSASDKCIKYYEKYCKVLNKRLKEKDNTEFKSILWTEDSNLTILPYQASGTNFCLRGNGGLIGDACGCGKTIQALACMCRVLENDPNANILIVVKNATRQQWVNEILRFTKIPKESVVIIGDRKYFRCVYNSVEDGEFNAAKKECKECKKFEYCKGVIKNQKKVRSHQIKVGQILITSYEVFRIEIKNLLKIDFDLMVFDEATVIKNPSAAVSKAAIKIAMYNEHAKKVVMSGTFVENNVTDLYVPMTIMDDKVFGDFGSFKKQYTIMDNFKSIVGVKNIDKLKSRIEPFLIRRTIDEVWKDRPELHQDNRILEMTKFQLDLYNSARDGVLKQLEDEKLQDKINYAGMIALLSYLLQLTCTVENLQEPKTRQSASIKIDKLREIISDDIGIDKKVVVFCRYANKVCPYIIRDLEKDGNKIVYIHGGEKDVASKINEFKEGKANVLLSTDVLEYGVNLQFCRYLININLPWNPAKLDQRIARVYRKGQEHAVHIINLICENSVDIMVQNKIYQKRDLFNSIFGGENSKDKKPSKSTLMEILLNA